MKIDKRLAQEFGVERHPPTPIDLVELIIASAVPVTFTVSLLGLGAFIERFVPLAVYVFAGASLLAASVIVVMFLLVLAADTVDMPPTHDDY